MYCCVYSEKTPDDVRKYAEFYSKNKFEKLVHLVGFIIRMFSRTKPRVYLSTVRNTYIRDEELVDSVTFTPVT